MSSSVGGLGNAIRPRMNGSNRKFFNQNGGINICCCVICSCVNFEFLKSKFGLLKICELLLSSFCETLLIRYGVPSYNTIGQSLITFLTSTAYCFTTISILLGCYVFSGNSFHLIRQSPFELVFNFIACSTYLSVSSCMGFVTYMFLYPQFLITPGYWTYPAMTAVYTLGYVLAALHGIDTYLAFKQFWR